MGEFENFRDIGFAKLDLRRAERTGTGEAVYCPGKTPEQLLGIFMEFRSSGVPALGTKCSIEQFDFLRGNGLDAGYDPVSKVVTVSGEAPPPFGLAAICTGGTADIPVAEEAARTAEFFGVRVERHFDVGVAGIHRLFARLDAIRRADVVVAVAGMEGALAGVIAGLVEAPVVAVPTSVGYGASFEGITPLLTMMNSCAEGVSVVNIDNGFGAGILVCRMIRMAERKKR